MEETRDEIIRKKKQITRNSKKRKEKTNEGDKRKKDKMKEK